MKKRISVKIPILILTFCLIILSISFYIHSSYKIYFQQANYEVQQSSIRASKELDAIISQAKNNIKLTSELVSQKLKSPVLENEVFEEYVKDTPFKAIEFIDRNGVNSFNLINKNVKYHVSDKEVFVKGMQGQSGIWTNCFPIVSREVLLQFYSPLYFKNEVVGILTGVIGGESNLKHILYSNFFGEDLIGILIDKDLNIITSTDETLFRGINLKAFEKNKTVSKLINNINDGNYDPFTIKGDENGIFCISRTKDSEFYVIQVLTEKSIKHGMKANIIRSVSVFLFIFITLIIYLFLVYKTLRKNASKIENSHLNIINALSSNYENIYIVNIESSKMFMYEKDSYSNKNIFHKQNIIDKSYDEKFSFYAQNDVYEDDRELFNKITTLEKVKKIFSNKVEYSFVFRTLRSYVLHYFQCTLFKPSEQSSEFVVCFKNVDNLILESNDNQDFEDIHEILQSGKWVMTFDRNSQITSCEWSGAFKKLLGYPENYEFENKIDFWRARVHEEDKKYVIEKLYKALNDYSGKTACDATYRLLTRENGYRWFRAMGKITRRADGTPLRLVGVFMEVDEQTRLMKNLSALAKIYLTMHVIDLDTDSIIELNTTDELKSVTKGLTSASAQMVNAMKNLFVEEYVEKALKFSNLNTVASRMKNKTIISEEILGKYRGWTRLSFIKIDSDEYGKPKDVIFVTQVIESEKRKEEKLIMNANTDELTQFLNRRAYENDIKDIVNLGIPENFVFISMDVNGLKVVNDTLGHEAGDELLKGAAFCMNFIFSKYGKLYRVGGDEFIAIVQIPEKEIENIKNAFSSVTSDWKGKHVSELSISCGYVTEYEIMNSSPSYTIEKISKIADRRMYEDKAIYYSTRGVDRRGQKL